MADTGFHILTMSHSMSLVFSETKTLIQYRRSHTPLTLTRKVSFMHLNLFCTEIFVVLIPPQSMFKMFPQLLWPENISFVKGWYWCPAITINDILLIFYRWRWSLIHHKNPLLKRWKISSRQWKILDSLHHQTELQLHQKMFGQAVSKLIMISLLPNHGSSMVCSVI